MSKYESLKEKILKNDKISSEKKIMLLKMLDLYITFLDDDPKEVEDEVYTVSDEVLPEEKKILYEYLNAKSKMVASNDDKSVFDNMKDKNIIIKDSYNYKYSLDEIIGLKEMVTEMQLNANIEPSFYTVFGKVLAKYLGLSSEDELKELLKEGKKKVNNK